MENPIRLSLKQNGNYIIVGSMIVPLEVEIIVNGSHYGIELLLENQAIKQYPTENPIIGIGTKGTTLKIFEDGKIFPWCFDSNGNMVEHHFNETSFNQLDPAEFKIKQKIKHL